MGRRRFGAVLLSLGMAAIVTAHANAATITVNGTADENSSTPANAVCTLREAILSANTNTAVGGCAAGAGASDTVVIPAGTFTLALAGGGEDAGQTGDLDVLGDTVLQGAGAGVTIIDGNALDRVVHVIVPAASLVQIQGVTIRNGKPEGILEQSGAVALSGVTVEKNAGSGVYSNDTATFTGSTVRLNGDGGVYGFGSLAFTGSLIENNSGSFGGVYSYNFLTMTGTTVAGNTTTGFGGGVFTAGEATITESTISGNTASSGAGLRATCFPNICGARVTIERSTISGNNGEGIASIGYAANTLTLVNSTVSGNTGTGIVNWGSYGKLVNTTVASNGGYAFDNSLSGLAPTAASFYNSILVGSCLTSTSTTMTSGGGNLESPGNTCNLTGPSDAVSVASPGLGSLAANGGPTKTHALLSGSPAIGTAIAANCPTTDQRGTARPSPAGGQCDKGSYEMTGCGSSLAFVLPPTLFALRRRRRLVLPD